MKGIVVTTDNVIEVKDFSQPLHESCGEGVDGIIEKVTPCGLSSLLCMLVNEKGQLRNLPINYIGSILYGAAIHGLPIFGNLVIMKNGATDDFLEVTGLEDRDMDYALPRLNNMAKALKSAVATA